MLSTLYNPMKYEKVLEEKWQLNQLRGDLARDLIQ